MRRHLIRSRLPVWSPLFAGASLIGWATGCAGLPSSLSALTPPTRPVAVADEEPGTGASGTGAVAPAPPSEPPAEALADAGGAPTASISAPAPPPAVVRSAATEALIVEELALAPVAERTELAREWAKLDEAMVEQVIRIRRMVRQLDAQTAPAAALAAARQINSPLVGPGATDPFAGAQPARVIPPGPDQFPIEVSRPTAPPPAASGPMYDPHVRPAAYYADPQPPGPRPTPGLLAPPTRSPSYPTRTAEASPSPAALRAPGGTVPDVNAANPLYDPGPTGFGPPASGGNAPGVDDFDGRVAALQLAARRRAERTASAVRAAVGPEEKAAAERAHAEAEIQLRLVHLIAGEHGRALEAVPGLPPAEQEFWQHTFWALSTEMDTQSIPDPADRATHAVAALRTAAVKLSERANLALKDVNFCHRVDSFGNVQTFDRDEFTPNEPVLIYAAVDNFTSERTLEGRFRTVLRSKVEIFRAGGTQLVETLPLDKPTTVDLCDNHRQDYFLIYELKIPARIGLGPHVLKLTVEDTLGNATAETELNFTVK